MRYVRSEAIVVIVINETVQCYWTDCAVGALKKVGAGGKTRHKDMMGHFDTVNMENRIVVVGQGMRQLFLILVDKRQYKI